MATGAIDFSDLGGRPVQQAQGSIDFSDLGGKVVQPASAAAAPGIPKPPNAIVTQELNNPRSPNFAGGMPGSFEGHPENIGEYVPASAGEIYGGGKNITQGNVAQGAHRIISGAQAGVAPMFPFAAASAPLMTLRALAGGYVGSKVASGVTQGLGATPDQAALAGDVGGFVGGGAGAAASVKNLKAPIKAAGPIADFLSDVIDPELTGVISPRLAHLQRLLGRYADLVRGNAPATPNAAATAAGPLEGEYMESSVTAPPAPRVPPTITPEPFNQRQLPQSATAARDLPYRYGPGSIVSDVVGQPNPRVLAGNQGVITTPKGLLNAPLENFQGQAPRTSPFASYQDNMEDQSIIDSMRNDLDMQQRAGLGEERRAFADRNSMDTPKWLRNAQGKAQMIVDQAIAKRNAPVKLTTTPPLKPFPGLSSPQQMGQSLDDLTSLLEASIRLAQQGKK